MKYQIRWQGDKIIKGIQTISALLTPARLKMMGIAAAILAVFLLVEDFVAFLQGKDSVIGELLKGAGVDVGEAREKIIGFFNGAKEVAGRVLTAIGDFWAKHKEKIFAVLQGAWSLVQVVFNLIYTFIRGVIDKIGAFWDEHGDDANTSSRKVQNGWKVTFLMNGHIQVNDYVLLESQEASGAFRVSKITAKGDTDGSGEDSWVCVAELLEVG